MVLTDCFAYRGDFCSALNTMICAKHAYCQFYKPESANCNRVKIEHEVDNYQGTKSIQGGTKRRYEKTYTKPTTVSQRDT